MKNINFTMRLLKVVLMTFLFQIHFNASAQQVDINNLKNTFKSKKFVRLNGGVSANSLIYTGSGESMRNPNTWVINGSLNINLFDQLNLPLSFNLTNLGTGFSYPNMPSRFSLNPIYKNIKGYVGDVNMTFSPYTLSGHQFTGAGSEVAVNKRLKVSGMAGRLQKAVEFDSSNQIVESSYKRMGYGAKVEYERENYKLGANIFYAKDNQNSLNFKPDSLNILPQQNIAMSYNASFRPVKGMELAIELATSILNRDIRDSIKHSGTGGFLKSGESSNSSSTYKAIKVQLNYVFIKSTIGVEFERVDPGYKTLGAYFFNNDLESISVNFAQPLLKNKMNFGFNLGYQRDDLDNSKAGSNKRVVSSARLSYSPSAKLSASANYSNFQTIMLIKPNFQFLNLQTPINNFDTLNFVQLSQNANLNLIYNIGKSTDIVKSVMLNVSFQDAADKQGGIIQKGNASQLYNMYAAYNTFINSKGINITTAYNLNYNTIGRNNFLLHGPLVSINGKMFKNMITTGLSSSYNITKTFDNTQDLNSVFNMRYNVGYIYKKSHNVNLGLIHQLKSFTSRGKVNDIIGNIGYNFIF